MNKLLEHYKKKKIEIKRRLKEFEKIGNGSDEEIFAELCFCLCTPQNKAKVCGDFLEKIKRNGILFNGTESEIKKFMKVRFRNNKSRYIVEARKLFKERGKIKIKNKLIGDSKEVREWLVKNVKGMGMKEASHFLRNIGMEKNLAILDRHILKNLQKYGVINEIPKTLTKRNYLEIEQKMRQFSKRIGISMNELDLLFWSEETGEIFK